MKRLAAIAVCLVVAGVLCSVAGGAQAGILSVSGAVVNVSGSPPANVGQNLYESNTQIRAFDEKQTVLVSSAITLDAGGSIPVGTWLDSHLIHFDKVGSTSTVVNSGPGTVTFKTNILGVMFTTTGLDNTDGYGRVGTTYPTGLGQARASNETGDSWSWAGSVVTITNLRTTTAQDQIRVFTAPSVIPEPSTWALFGIGALGLFGIARRRKAI